MIQAIPEIQKIIPPLINGLYCNKMPVIKVAKPNEICISGVMS